MRAIRWAAGLALLCVSLAQPAAAQTRGESGRFDFYVLALSWSPSFCEATRDRDPIQCRRPYGFVVHGLWPQFERGFPEFCSSQARRPNDELVRAMLELMPSPALVLHAWRKHGTCTGLSAEGYFDLLRRARERIVVPERLRGGGEPQVVAPSDIEAAFAAANPGLRGDMIAISCDHRRLREVRICLSKELAFRACPDVDRRGCRIPRVFMPATRDATLRL